MFREATDVCPAMLMGGDTSLASGDVVIVIVVLFAVSAATGFLLGYFCFHWLFIVASGLVIALTAAWILQANGIWVVGGLAAIVACLTINQFAFLAGGMLRKGRETGGND